MNSIEEVCRKYSFTVIEVYTAGHVCPAVYKVHDRDGKTRVMKVGNDPVTIREIAKNLEGYETLKKIGLSKICPHIYFSEIRPESALIVMEYCGKDFHASLETDTNPEAMFKELVSQLVNVYRDSARVESPARNIQGVLLKILEQYEMYLAAVFDPNRQLRPLLEVLPACIKIEALKRSCFSSWDFTPRNVFLTKNGMKYIDCNDNVLGVPIIDLACFAGVARDIHLLPGSVGGYDLLTKLAVEEVSDVLEIDPIQSLKLFQLGRVLQLFLGARFRIKTDFVLATKFYKDAVEFLEKIIV